MDIKTRSIDDLLWALRQFRGADPAAQRFLPGYTLWLGAGASVESDIMTAPQLAMSALKILYSLTSGRSLPSDGDHAKVIDKWARSKKYFDPENRALSKYAQIMENIFPSVGLREQFLRMELRKARMSVGYHILGELLKRGVFDNVITTNFDHLVRQGADMVLPLPIEEVNSAEQYLHLNPVPTEPRLIRLHGDFWHGNLRNTEDELNQTPSMIFEAIKKIFCSYGLIVIGYGGEDVNVTHGLFHGLWKESNMLRNGLYWCDIKPKGQLSPMVKTLLSEGGKINRAFYVQIEGFDSLLKRIGSHFGIDDSIEKEMEKDIKQDWEWLALLTDLIDRASADRDGASLQKQLEQIVRLLGADRALVLSRVGESGGWGGMTSPDRPLPPLDDDKVTEWINQLFSKDPTYAVTAREELRQNGLLSKFFKSSDQIESFPVRRGDRLMGLVAFASNGRPLIEQQRLRLIRAAAKLLVGF